MLGMQPAPFLPSSHSIRALLAADPGGGLEPAVIDGYINLLRAVIDQAVRDATQPTGRNKTDKKRNHREAIEWFYSDSLKPMSFRWCVEHLHAFGTDTPTVEQFRSRLEEYREKCA